MDAVTEPSVHTVVVMSSAQVGKTEVLNNVVGYHMDQEPAPMLLLQPTLEMAHTWSKDRLAPMVRDTPCLRTRVKDARARDSGNTLLHKTFPGGHITMAGANSPASLASRPVRLVLCDEVDRYPPSAGTEGDPVSLAKKRTATFWNARLVLVSTPTIRGLSRIEREYALSDQRRFYVPCPQCARAQALVWAQVSWPDGEPDKAGYGCEHCGALWDEAQRRAAIAQGQWRAGAAFDGRAGFHLNELYSPWSSLAAIAAHFLESRKSPQTRKVWANTCLGETWEEEGETVEGLALYARREQYAAAVPAGALLLTLGVDVQDDRLEYEVVGWDADEQSWNVDAGVIHGDPGQRAVWEQLDALLERTYQHEGGTALHIAATAIDSGGHFTQVVYDYCRERKSRRVFAIKGMAGEGRAVVSAPNRKQSGRKRRKVDLYIVGVDDAKTLLYARLRQAAVGPGYCHFPLARDEEYFRQLTAETSVTRYVRSFPRREWRKTRARNEALDCRVYAYAALRILNPQWGAFARKLRVETPPPDRARSGQSTPVRRQHRHNVIDYEGHWFES